MFFIINSITPIFLLIFLGWICTRIKLFNKEQSATFNNYAYYIALPVLIFQTLSKVDFALLVKSNFVLANILAIFLAVLIIYFVGRLFRFQRRSLGMFTVAAFLGNVAFIGIPFHFLLLGQEGVIYASLNAALVTFLASTLGIYLIGDSNSRAHSWKDRLDSIMKIIFKPMVLSVLIAVLFSFLKINLPQPLERVLEIIAASTTSVALFAVGIFIYGNSLKERLGLTVLLTLGSLVIMPLIAWLATWVLPLSKMETTVTVLQAAMPLATMNFILAHQFKIEEKLIANAILLSTVLSAVTLPAWLWLIS